MMISLRLRLGIFALLALVQLLVPASMILARETTLKEGHLFRLRTAPVDPYDLFRGRYVSLMPEVPVCPPPATQLKAGQWVYAQLETDEEGFARCSALSLQALKNSTAYLRLRVLSHHADYVNLDWPFDRYYLEEPLAPAAERAYQQMSVDAKSWITLRIRSGQGVLEELYLNELPLRSYLNQLPTEP